MLQAVVRLLFPILLMFLVSGCIEVKLTPDTLTYPPQPSDTVSPDIAVKPPTDSTTEPADWILTDAATPTDDATAPWIECATHCDCPNGQDCINDRCVEGTLPIYCCTQTNCPPGASCWDSLGTAGTCP